MKETVAEVLSEDKRTQLCSLLTELMSGILSKPDMEKHPTSDDIRCLRLAMELYDFVHVEDKELTEFIRRRCGLTDL